MAKTIVALQGRANIGKTETIKEFRTLLKSTYPSHNETLFENNCDVKTIIEIKCHNKTIKIGIESQGDPYSRLTDQRLQDFVAANCDLIFCACRTSGMTVEVVTSVAGKNNYDVIYTGPYISLKNHKYLNQLKANHLLSFI